MHVGRADNNQVSTLRRGAGSNRSLNYEQTKYEERKYGKKKVYSAFHLDIGYQNLISTSFQRGENRGGWILKKTILNGF
jgi:hypothetical protein